MLNHLFISYLIFCYQHQPVKNFGFWSVYRDHIPLPSVPEFPLRYTGVNSFRDPAY
jgi:hypothetical protein